jgi:hypothetical protein
MKARFCRTGLGCTLAAIVVGLAGCASTSEYASIAPSTDSSFVTDTKYIATVEELAKHRGIRVKWVNPPVKRVARND